MRRITLLTCLGLVLTAGLVPAQPEPDRDLLAPHLEALGAKKKATRLAALKKIGAQGLAARAAVADLGKHMRDDPDEQVAGQAARALAQIGPAGVPELIEGVRHDKVAVRNRALWALGLMGPEGKEAVSALADALDDPQANLRVMAAYALGEMEAAAKPAIPALCKALRDKDAKVRWQAALALRNIGADAVPGIQELLKDDDIKVRLEALQAATQIGPDAKAAVNDLAELLHDDSAKVRIAAADALWSIGPNAKDAIPALISVMRDKNGNVQQHAFQAILRIGSADVPGLLETMRKLNAEAHWAFPYMLRQFGPKAKDAVKPLMKQLQAPEDGQRMSAALALSQIGKEAGDAVPDLQKALKDKNPMVRHSAGFALMRIMAEPPNLAKQLQDAADQVDAETRQAVARALMPKPWRPLNRKALFDPQVQDQFNQIVDVHLIYSATKNAAGKVVRLQLIPDDLETQAAAAINAFEPEAAPALIRGIHLAAYYKLGFC